MSKYDVSGILMTYSLKAKDAMNAKHLEKIIRDLKDDLDMRKIALVESEG